MDSDWVFVNRLSEIRSKPSLEGKGRMNPRLVSGRRAHQWLFRNSGGMTAKLKLSGSGDGEKLIRIRNAEHVGFENQRVGLAAGAAGPGSRVGSGGSWAWQQGRQRLRLGLAVGSAMGATEPGISSSSSFFNPVSLAGVGKEVKGDKS